ncbi:hypothetical protein BDR26DRAFT_867290 [Obelidium mucronatum]|nr:hypothetical protein BDR26DRAFT_867290 [Obelidium mucronatum]
MLTAETVIQSVVTLTDSAKGTVPAFVETLQNSATDFSSQASPTATSDSIPAKSHEDSTLISKSSSDVTTTATTEVELRTTPQKSTYPILPQTVTADNEIPQATTQAPRETQLPQAGAVTSSFLQAAPVPNPQFPIPQQPEQQQLLLNTPIIAQPQPDANPPPQQPGVPSALPTVLPFKVTAPPASNSESNGGSISGVVAAIPPPPAANNDIPSQAANSSDSPNSISPLLLQILLPIGGLLIAIALFTVYRTRQKASRSLKVSDLEAMPTTTTSKKPTVQFSSSENSIPPREYFAKGRRPSQVMLLHDPYSGSNPASPTTSRRNSDNDITGISNLETLQRTIYEISDTQQKVQELQRQQMMLQQAQLQQSLDNIHQRGSIFSEISCDTVTTNSQHLNTSPVHSVPDRNTPQIISPNHTITSNRGVLTNAIDPNAPSILLGYVQYNGNRWPVAKAIGGRWVWVGENTQVYRGAEDRDHEVVRLNSAQEARSVYLRELANTDSEFSDLQQKLYENWELFLTFF